MMVVRLPGEEYRAAQGITARAGHAHDSPALDDAPKAWRCIQEDGHTPACSNIITDSMDPPAHHRWEFRVHARNKHAHECAHPHLVISSSSCSPSISIARPGPAQFKRAPPRPLLAISFSRQHLPRLANKKHHRPKMVCRKGTTDCSTDAVGEKLQLKLLVSREKRKSRSIGLML